jgi:hypothetical protein
MPWSPTTQTSVGDVPKTALPVAPDALVQVTPFQRTSEDPSTAHATVVEYAQTDVAV